MNTIEYSTRFRYNRTKLVLGLAVFFLVFIGRNAGAAGVDALQEQLGRQQQMIEQQQRLIEEQTRQLNELKQRIEHIESATPAATEPPSKADAAPTENTDAAPVSRDEVGDLRSRYLTPGEFPGSILIPDPSGDVSIDIGGFVKTLAIYDNKLESKSVIFLPGRLRPVDQDGETLVNAYLSRLTLEVRATRERSKFRAYYENDFNSSSNFNLRHIYGSWTAGKTELLVGHTWSNMMDLQTLPDGLGEPTVSGAIFARQPQFRWTQNFGTAWSTALALENPDANDMFDAEQRPFRSTFPDIVGRVTLTSPTIGHLQVSGIVRQAELDPEVGDSPSQTGYGFQLSGHLNLFAKDRFYASASWGEGLGRYLLGLSGSDGAVVDERGNIQSRENYGGFAGYQHHWTALARSTVTVGYARAVPESFQTGSEVFDSSIFALGNLLWTLSPFVTLGAEYNYGQRENEDGSTLENHRVMIGVQLF